MRSDTNPVVSNAALVLVVAVTALVASGCKPDVGEPPSLVHGPRLLAIRQTPPEVMPGAPTQFAALVVDVGGTLPTGIAWSICNTPKSPSESNSVSQACVTQPDDDVAHVEPVDLTMPADACSLFGPDPPPVTPPIRPRDPDLTGGFFVPVRASAATPDGATLLAFAFERVRCNLANAPGDVVRAYNMAYVPNQNPIIADVVLDPDGAAPTSLLTGEGAAVVASASRVTLRAVWAAEAAESYPLYDPPTRSLVNPREALGASWFATDGAFEHDRTGRGGDEPETFTDDEWSAPTVTAPTAVHVWVVLRDERGGVDFAAFDLTVVP